MKNQELITKAVSVHFAIDNKKNFTCMRPLEDSITIASDFLNFFLNGVENEKFTKAMQTHRYRVKRQLIERYIRNHEH